MLPFGQTNLLPPFCLLHWARVFRSQSVEPCRLHSQLPSCTYPHQQHAWRDPITIDRIPACKLCQALCFVRDPVGLLSLRRPRNDEQYHPLWTDLTASLATPAVLADIVSPMLYPSKACIHSRAVAILRSFEAACSCLEQDCSGHAMLSLDKQDNEIRWFRHSGYVQASHRPMSLVFRKEAIRTVVSLTPSSGTPALFNL